MHRIRQRRRPVRALGRRGLTLMEVMVVIAILLVLVVVMVPSLNSVFQVKQRKAAQNLGLLYERLNDEAVMRNVTFRVVYVLDENRYVIEAGEADARVAATPEDRERWEEMRKRKIELMDEEELREYNNRQNKPFNKVEGGYRTEFDLPRGVRFGGVYTPQYGEMVEPDPDWKEDHEGEPQRVYSYIFANGFSEHTVIWLVDEGDPEEGWTIEVEPMSGNVRLHGELVEWEDSFDFVPEYGPDLPS